MHCKHSNSVRTHTHTQALTRAGEAARRSYDAFAGRRLQRVRRQPATEAVIDEVVDTLVNVKWNSSSHCDVRTIGMCLFKGSFTSTFVGIVCDCFLLLLLIRGFASSSGVSGLRILMKAVVGSRFRGMQFMSTHFMHTWSLWSTLLLPLSVSLYEASVRASLRWHHAVVVCFHIQPRHWMHRDPRCGG